MCQEEKKEENSLIMGIPQQHPLKDVYDIFGDIERLGATSPHPCQDLEYLILNSYKLWDMYNQVRETEIKNIVLKVKEHEI